MVEVTPGIKTSEGIGALSVAAGALVAGIAQLVIVVSNAVNGEPIVPELLGTTIASLVTAGFVVWGYVSGRTKIKIAEMAASVETQRIAAHVRAAPDPSPASKP